jgi:crotonobetainyl-CoA:carnitine CoA-transferase CaiB-like acyl-CoA transferase
MRGLKDVRVVDLCSEIAGPYCTKLFADAGADVIKVEPPAGDPLRRWSASFADLGGHDAALFRFLNASKRSVVGTPSAPEVEALLASADLVVEDWGAAADLDRGALLERNPGLVLLSISAYGLTGPYAERPWTEFTLQAECSSIAIRGVPGEQPYQAGSRTTEWIGGTFASVAALAAVQRARATGHGEQIDFSLLEVMSTATNMYFDLMWGMLGRPPVTGAAQNVESPSIHPTRDGYVGVTTNTQQQLADFLLLIGRPDLRQSGEFNQIGQRMARLSAWEAAVEAFTREHTTAEIIEQAGRLRIPAAPVCDGARVLAHEQLVARGVYSEDPSGGFLRPRVPYLVDGKSPPPPRPAPRLGEHTGRIEARSHGRPTPSGQLRLPLAGIRVLDVSAWWAGPCASHMLACLGADVLHVESARKPDASRMVGAMFAGKHERWWECSMFFLSANSNKRGCTLDLQDARGRELLLRMVERADILLENYSPRVMDGFGISVARVREANPRCIYARMPAFGLDGPWRDRVGFAQTMEQLSGLAWLTGHRHDQPRIQRGPCDPLAGVHAVFAMLLALQERELTGRGAFLECAMVEGALNVAAELVIEWTAYGNALQRDGNRSPTAAPQGLYACRGHDPVQHPQWLALSVATDAQWRALIEWLGQPDWTADLWGASLAARRAAHDAIDAHLRPVFAQLERDLVVNALLAAGIPAAAPIDPRALSDHPQLRHRRFFEELTHPVVGTQKLMSMPFHFASVERWLHTPAPTLGQHNTEQLHELGLSAQRISELETAGVIGTRPVGV